MVAKGFTLEKLFASSNLTESKCKEWAPVIETEAYDGEADLACHARKGKTGRTKVMYEDAGICYVIFVMVFIGFEFGNRIQEDYPAAVPHSRAEDFTGPGRLTKEWVSMVVLMRNL